MDEPLKILATDINEPRESTREVTCVSPDQTKTEKNPIIFGWFAYNAQFILVLMQMEGWRRMHLLSQIQWNLFDLVVIN